MSEVKNARIRSTTLGVEDHGILTAYLNLEYDGGGQGFGGYALDRWDGEQRIGTAWGMEFIRRVLNTLEVDAWEKLPGTPCRVKADYGKVYEIGHYLKDRWFEPQDLEATL